MSVMRVRSVAAGSGTANASYSGRAESAKVTKTSQRDSAYFSSRAFSQSRAAANEDRTSASADNKTAAGGASEEVKDVKEVKKSISEMVKEQTEKLDKMFGSDESENTSKSNRLMLIKQKMRGGLTLSADDEKYLSKHDPDSYSNYRTTQDARKTFRMQLMCCRTKDEVNSMRLSNALSALSSYKKALKNGGDGSAVAGLNMAFERDISSFSQSARYRSLPTAAERDKYYMDLAKARKFEREKQQAKKLNAQRKKKKQVKVPGDGKRTVAQVQNSAIGKKVRNAGRGSCGVCFSSFASSSYRKMDQKG